MTDRTERINVEDRPAVRLQVASVREDDGQLEERTDEDRTVDREDKDPDDSDRDALAKVIVRRDAKDTADVRSSSPR